MRVNQGTNPWCGPAVLSILTGKNTDECAKVVGNMMGVSGTYVTGVTIQHMLAAITKLGGSSQRLNSLENCSLFMALYGINTVPGKYLVMVKHTRLINHYIALEVRPDRTISMCDNRTQRDVKIEASIELSRRVLQIWRIDIAEPMVYENSGREAEFLVTQSLAF